MLICKLLVKIVLWLFIRNKIAESRFRFLIYFTIFSIALLFLSSYELLIPGVSIIARPLIFFNSMFSIRLNDLAYISNTFLPNKKFPSEDFLIFKFISTLVLIQS